MRQNSSSCNFSTSDNWVILSNIEQSIKRKIESIGTPLKEWDIQINYGIKTGFNDAFIISTEKRNEILNNCTSEEERKKTDELIRPILRGRDIKRYSYEWNDLWLIATFPSRHYDIEDYPAVKSHLLSFGKERLEQSGKKHKINGEDVKARKKTNNKWFETQDSISYWDDFNKPKLVYPETTQGAFFAYDEKEIYIDKTCFMVTGKDEKTLVYLQKTLSSRLFEFAYKNIFSSIELGQNGFQYNKHALIKLPVSEEIIELPDNEEEINNIVYQIYNMCTEEINLIKS